MTSLILAWIAVVLAVFGIAYWLMSPTGRTPWPWIVAAITTGLFLWRGADAYAESIAAGAYTAATLIIPIVPIKALFLGSLGYGATRFLDEAWRKVEPDMIKRWGLAAALTVAFAYFGGSEILGAMASARERTAASDRLTPEQIAAITVRVTSGTAGESEVAAFLRNPLCPPDLLSRYAAGTVLQKTSILQNPSLAAELAVQLSRDTDPLVRYYAVDHERLPVDELVRLSNDTDPSVRARTAWMARLPDSDLLRLAADPDEDVRNTVANQDRLSNAALKSLLTDPSPQVRATAERKAAYRTLD